jgi:hypothetical protein
MVTIELTQKDLIVHVRRAPSAPALGSTLKVHLSHVSGARSHPQEAYFDGSIVDAHGVAKYVPGEFVVGTVQLDDGQSFLDVRDPRRAIAIDLVDEPLQHIVVEVGDESPEAVVRRIQDAVLAP